MGGMPVAFGRVQPLHGRFPFLQRPYVHKLAHNAAIGCFINLYIKKSPQDCTAAQIKEMQSLLCC